MLVAAMLASAWVALVLSAPWLPVPVAGIVYVFGGRICHQLAERSFFLDGAQLPVCARCLGIAVGAAAGLLLSGSLCLNAAVRRQPTGVGLAMLLVLVLNFVTLGDGSNAVRAGAGAALGVAVACAIRGAFADRRLPMPATAHTKHGPIH